MIYYDSGHQLTIKIDKYLLPLSPDALGGLSIKEDMGDFHVSGRLVFQDVLGIYFHLAELKGEEPLEIHLYEQSTKTEYTWAFTITEITSVSDVLSHSNQIDILFMSPSFDAVQSPAYSRGFGNVIASAVVKDILDDVGYESLDVDSSIQPRVWIQPMLNNRQFVELLSKWAVSATARVNDYCYYTTRDNVFHFKSYKGLGQATKSFILSNIPTENSIYFRKFVYLNRAPLFKSVGGYGTTVWYFDEATNTYKSFNSSMDRSPIGDTATHLGVERIPISKRQTAVFDYGPTEGSVEDTIKSESSHHWFTSMQLMKELEIPNVGFYPVPKIGQSCELNLYFQPGDTNPAFTGKYLLVGNELIFDKSTIKTNFRIMRIGYNDGVGRRLT